MLNRIDIQHKLNFAGAMFKDMYMDEDEFLCIEFTPFLNEFGERKRINYDIIRGIALPDWEQAEIYDNMITLFPATEKGFNEYIRIYQANFKAPRKSALIGLEIILENYASKFVRDAFFRFYEPTKKEMADIQKFDAEKSRIYRLAQ